ncbi:unnamed protein product [Owenia fusiformis]|uniref:Uncharacterized protein n=1 Tax=Owenia fusiformis TaxID=6347 RepID=A0A8J1T5C3_OWEFU|nr:unnamed protein product [Owenia fusiformis]
MRGVRFSGHLYQVFLCTFIWNTNYSFATFSVPSLKRNSSLSANIAAKEPGNIILGGLFPVHEKGQGDIHCGKINTNRGIQRLEAMLFTIDEINRRSDILPDVKLGANILDTCSRDTYALEQSLEYVRASMSTLDASEFKCEDGSTATSSTAPKAIAGVIGGSYSSVSIQVANLLRLFKIPQISYASTSAALSDKIRFDFFARTVPPDTLQAKAMVDIVVHFNWTYISTVSSEGDYGQNGMDSFIREARGRNICYAVNEKIPASSTDADLDEVIKNLLLKSSARAVVMFTRGEDARALLSAATRNNVTDKFVWIASDGWGKQDMPVRDNELAAEGALTIELQSTPIPAFDTYFMGRTPRNNIRNPWFNSYWEHVFKCKLNGISNTTLHETIPFCTGDEKISKRVYKQESKVQFVYDAVYAISKALDSMYTDLCPKRDGLCSAMKTISGDELYRRYILNVSFTDGFGGLVQFDKNGDGLGRYNIMNYQRNRRTGKYEYHVIGKWATGVLTLEPKGHLVWAGGRYEMPTSQCSKPCNWGEIKHVQQGDNCCWLCTKCQPWEFLKDEFTCVDCGPGLWPHENKMACFMLPEQYMQWGSIYAIVPMALSCIGMLVTIVTMLTFVRHNETPVVKASGRELSFMLLSGCLICYLMSFILLAKPTLITCALQRFGVGFGFSVIYASLLTKTNRISRIFYSASRSAKRPAFISPKSQMVISSILISIQVVCTGVWLVLEPPGTRKYFPNGRRDEVILKCNIQDLSFLISLIYNMLLILICTVYAVKTRRIPENFNESKFIGFTMYTTCIIWLAFVPIYFGTLNSFEIQITTLCISISLSASVALLCLFAPKMYIIVFQPEKNVRKLTMNHNHSTNYSSASYVKANCGGSLTKPNNNSNHKQIEGGNCIPASPDHEVNNIQLNYTSPLKAGACTETDTDPEKDSLTSL